MRLPSPKELPIDNMETPFPVWSYLHMWPSRSYFSEGLDKLEKLFPALLKRSKGQFIISLDGDRVLGGRTTGRIFPFVRD